MSSDKELLDFILRSDEGINLEFKARIELGSNEGKAKFIKTILALANSPIKPSFLALGVEDKTKSIVGCQEDVNEERLQNIVHAYCKPPVLFAFKKIKHEDLEVGLINIIGHRRPYTPKEKFLELLSGKQGQEISDKTVFVRHGSTTDTAYPEEIMEMEGERVKIQNESTSLDGLISEVADLESSVERTRWTLERIENTLYRDRATEYAFLGITSGIAVGLLQFSGWQYAAASAILLSPMISIVSSTLKLIGFGIYRSIIIGLLIGAGIILLMQLDNFIYPLFLGGGPQLITILIWNSLKGLTIGLFVAWWTGRGETGV